MLILILQFLILALSPLYILRFNIFGLPSTLLESLLWIYFISFVVRFCKEGMKWQKFVGSFNYPISLFLGAAIISVFVSPDLWGGLGILRAYFLEPILFFYTLIYLDSLKSVKAVSYGLLAAAFC